MELYNGRPEDTSGRKEKEIKVYDILDSLHIPYIRADHEAVMTMEACEEIDKALGMEICKNLFLCNRKKTSYYLLLMPGNKALKTKELSQQIPTTRLSFASGEDMETYLNVTPGSATVMGLIFDQENKVQLLVDEELLVKFGIGRKKPARWTEKQKEGIRKTLKEVQSWTQLAEVWMEKYLKVE